MSKYKAINVTMKNKVPYIPILINLLFAHFIYTPCPWEDKYKKLFETYYTLLAFSCFIWEYVHAYLYFKKTYPKASKHERNIYISISALISTGFFIVLTYFLQEGKPFSCYMKYDKTVAVSLFLMMCTVISIFAAAEHLWWKDNYDFETDICNYQNKKEESV